MQESRVVARIMLCVRKGVPQDKMSNRRKILKGKGSISSWTTVRAWLVISMAVVIETTAVVIELFSVSVQVTEDETEEISVAKVSTTVPSGKLVAMEITKREDYF